MVLAVYLWFVQDESPESKPKSVLQMLAGFFLEDKQDALMFTFSNISPGPGPAAGASALALRHEVDNYLQMRRELIGY